MIRKQMRALSADGQRGLKDERKRDPIHSLVQRQQQLQLERQRQQQLQFPLARNNVLSQHHILVPCSFNGFLIIDESESIFSVVSVSFYNRA